MSLFGSLSGSDCIYRSFSLISFSVGRFPTVMPVFFFSDERKALLMAHLLFLSSGASFRRCGYAVLFGKKAV